MDMSLSKLQEIVKDQSSLVCCSPWGGKESDMTEHLNNKKHGLIKAAMIWPSLSNNLVFLLHIALFCDMSPAQAALSEISLSD